MNNYLVHYAKGASSRKHKYIRIENGRYIYPEDLKSPSYSVNSKPKKDKIDFNGGSTAEMPGNANGKDGGNRFAAYPMGEPGSDAVTIPKSQVKNLINKIYVENREAFENASDEDKQDLLDMFNALLKSSGQKTNRITR